MNITSISALNRPTACSFPLPAAARRGPIRFPPSINFFHSCHETCGRPGKASGTVHVHKGHEGCKYCGIWLVPTHVLFRLLKVLCFNVAFPAYFDLFFNFMGYAVSSRFLDCSIVELYVSFMMDSISAMWVILAWSLIEKKNLVSAGLAYANQGWCIVEVGMHMVALCSCLWCHLHEYQVLNISFLQSDIGLCIVGTLWYMHLH